MPAAIEMGPHPAGAAFYCPCGKIYPKYRSLVSHQARNADCGAASRARSDRIDAECRALARRDAGKPESVNTAAEIRELKRREHSATVSAVSARQAKGVAS